MKRLVLIAALLLLVVSACGDDDDSGDSDEPLGAGPFAVADLTITYQHPNTGTIAYQLVCLGDTATLLGDVSGVNASSACKSLADPAVQQRLVDGAPSGQACTEIYGGPETAAIAGTVEGDPVDTEVDRANGCGIADWDGLLQPILPEPLPFS